MTKKLFVFLFICLSAAYAQDEDPEPDKAQKGESIFIAGMKSYLAEDYPEALGYFNRVIKEYQPTAGVYHMKAKTLAGMGDLPQAIASASQSVQIDAQNIMYQKFLAGLFAQNHDYGPASEIYLKIIRQEPLNPETHILLADIYETTGEYDQALKVYETLERNIGSDEEISRKKQALYLRQNKVNEAIKEGDKLIDSQPLEPSYVINQAQIMIGNSELNEAEKLLTQYLSKNPDLGEAHILLAEIYRRKEDSKASVNELRLAFDNPELDPAVKLKVLGSFLKVIETNPRAEDFDLAIELCQKMIEIQPKAALAYMYLGDLQMRKGLLKEARDSYRKSTEFDKSVYEVWLALIELDTRLQDTQAIVKHAGEASEYFPNQPFFWYHYGFGNILKKDYEEAIYALEEARAISFDNTELLKNVLALLGDAYNETRKYFESEKAYEEALKIDPDYAPVLNNYSYFLATRKKNLQRALELSDRLIKLEPDNLNYADTHAWVLFQMGEFAAARNGLEKLIQQTPKPTGTAMEHYGDILFKLGDKAGALNAWKKARELGENSLLIERKLSEEQYIE